MTLVWKIVMKIATREIIVTCHKQHNKIFCVNMVEHGNTAIHKDKFTWEVG